ncbi:MAG TPA: RNA degradosome polyphosphate kinase, partial [Bacteroidetes bacterium]|nr:RNA degradosome polyphosphate kinase [Bacteroidota bacterium]
NDPFVKEIKITQYRFAKNSAIVDILKSALKFGKKVLLFSEVKARFDEELNLKYSEELKDAGAEIIYSLPGLKVHSKIASVTRLENDGEKKYVYISTGNFNENTSKIYTDIALFTSDNEVTEDTEKVFKILKTGTVTNNTPEPKINENLASNANDIQTETPEVNIKDLKNTEFKQLLVSGFNMRKSFIRLIESEIENAKSGKESFIIAKMNSLEDKKIINKLYQASQAGVKIKLIVRGICCLIPGVPALSENIKVISIVDRFLEHSRVYIFYNDGNPLIYLSSADWMKRNLSRRIEIAVPVNQNNLRTYLIDVINLQLKDNVKARIINPEQDNSDLNKSVAEDLRSQIEISNYLKNLK